MRCSEGRGEGDVYCHVSSVRFLLSDRLSWWSGVALRMSGCAPRDSVPASGVPP